MNADTTVLRDSMYSCYTASGYSRWKETVIPTINRYQQEMKGLNRLRITGHEQLSEDVSVTTYENGTKVYVNYSNSDFRAGTITVPARDYLVKGGDGK
jgi:hypothetical protein